MNTFAKDLDGSVVKRDGMRTVRWDPAERKIQALYDRLSQDKTRRASSSPPNDVADGSIDESIPQSKDHRIAM